jgi:hypothetical protein
MGTNTARALNPKAQFFMAMVLGAFEVFKNILPDDFILFFK